MKEDSSAMTERKWISPLKVHKLGHKTNQSRKRYRCLFKRIYEAGKRKALGTEAVLLVVDPLFCLCHGTQTSGFCLWLYIVTWICFCDSVPLCDTWHPRSLSTVWPLENQPLLVFLFLQSINFCVIVLYPMDPHWSRWCPSLSQIGWWLVILSRQRSLWSAWMHKRAIAFQKHFKRN